MSNAKSVLYSSYGGFQLKATYQRNLLMANLVVMAMIAGLLASAQLWGTEPLTTGERETLEPDVLVSLRPSRPPVIKRDTPKVKVV